MFIGLIYALIFITSCNKFEVESLSDTKSKAELLNALNFIKNKYIPLKTSIFGKETNLDDLDIIELEGGVTNYCYKCYNKKIPTKAVFIKHAKPETRGFGNLPLSTERLFYEFEGMKSFAKYTADLVPKSYLFDEEEKYLVNEYLDAFQPFQNLFVNGNIGIDSARFIGKIFHLNLFIYFLIFFIEKTK
jgi:5-methylthioribose kinase